jgi:hypothetical protein
VPPKASVITLRLRVLPSANAAGSASAFASFAGESVVKRVTIVARLRIMNCNCNVLVGFPIPIQIKKAKKAEAVRERRKVTP